MDVAPSPVELVVDQKTGLVRQAGATTPEGEWIRGLKLKSEQSLFTFAVSVLGLTRLTLSLHYPVCQWLTRIPPFRKLLLLPRDHLKTSITGRSLPMHILIQPKDSNLYYPGKDGGSTRILLANEKATNAENQLRWISQKFESNKVLRAFWPHRVWDNPRRQSKKWSEQAIQLPRDEDYPEASIETIGVDGAITGRHYDVLIKDDLISIEAANSMVVMQNAIDWHKASRALLDDPDRSLEFIIGTRWAVFDLYQDILDSDHSVETMVKSAIENGQPIYPRQLDTKGQEHGFTLKALIQLSNELGIRFPLLYMNTPYDPSLVDFDVNELRAYEVVGDHLKFAEDERDAALMERYAAPLPPQISVPTGVSLSQAIKDGIFRGRSIRRGVAS